MLAMQRWQAVVKDWYRAFISAPETAAQNRGRRSPPASVSASNSSASNSVQPLLHSIVILRILECWGLEPAGQLGDCQTWADLDLLCHQVGDRYFLQSFQRVQSLLLPDRWEGLFLSLIADLYAEPWTTALDTTPGLVLEWIQALNPPQGIAKSRGAYYTPTSVVNTMVADVFKEYGRHQPLSPALTILDPACGFGAFLVAVWMYWLQRKRNELPSGSEHSQFDALSSEGDRPLDPAKPAPSTLLEHLPQVYGVDLDVQAVDTTKLLLMLTLWQFYPPPVDQRRAIAQRQLTQLSQHICWGNAVIAPDVQDLDASPDQLQRIRPLDWAQTFPQVSAAGGFDWVIGNPPYLDSEWMTQHLPLERQYCARRYQSAVGNWDLYCVFVEQALRLCKLGGLTSLIVPHQLQSAPYAAATRRLLTVDNTLLRLRDYAQVATFPVAVYPLVYLAQNQPPPDSPFPVRYDRMGVGDETDDSDGSLRVITSHTLPYGQLRGDRRRTWCTSPVQVSRLIERIEAGSRPLGAIATVLGAATVAEAYDIQPLIQDKATVDSATTLRLVNSGTIDRYTILWGRKPLRYLKRSYLYPIIANADEVRLPKARQQQARQPKIIVASMTRVLECVADAHGTLLAGKSTSIVLSSVALPFLLAILNSRLMSCYYALVFGGNALQGGYLRVGTTPLRSLPIRLPGAEATPLGTGIMDAVMQRMSLPQSATDSRAARLEQVIDRWVYQLYGFSVEDIAELEASVTIP
jgi:hypothetical protein